MKKYELTQNTKIILGHTLYQIKALIDIPEKNVRIGDLGGYIQSEGNLSHQGTCWVDEKAKVWGRAKVYDNAWIYDYGSVSGKGQVYDNAQVYGRAMVYHNARIYGQAEVYGNARVFDNVDVYDKALVYGDAQVHGLARVFDEAQVLDNARVYGWAEVYGDAFVYGEAEVSANLALIGGTWTETPISIIGLKDNICQCDTNKIKIGSNIKTFNQWIENFEQIGKEYGYTDKQIKEYKIYIDAIINANKI